MLKPPKTKEEQVERKLKCGIVMPISEFGGYTREHWKDVLDIISECAVLADFEPNIVSYANEAGIIQANIVQNLFNNDIVVVDVSGKNPNVMFELGMRLAFDKPTIIIKDELTDYAFDTAPIEHLPYPSNLHYQSILKFKESLKNKIDATYKRATAGGEDSTFLKHFGQFKVAKLEEKEVSSSEYILNKIDELGSDLRAELRTIRNNQVPTYFNLPTLSDDTQALLRNIKRVDGSYIKFPIIKPSKINLDEADTTVAS